MAVATEFFHWQTSGLNPLAPPYEACAPNLLANRTGLKARWGGRYLGCHNNRNIRGSAAASWSTHAWGAALDWRYEPAGDDKDHLYSYPGRQVVVDEVLPWLIEYSAELGIDAIHDYATRRLWRAGEGWRTARISGGAWLHLEVHRDTFGWATPIADRGIGVEPPPPAPRRRVDLLDISQHQTITKWADVPQVPIVHRVIRKEGDLDARFASRMPVIAERTEIFGGYVVLVGGIARQQTERLIEAMLPFWRPGAFDQFDVEPWSGLPLPTVDEIAECIAIHDEAFGFDRTITYMNPYVAGTDVLWYDYVDRFPNRARWIPGYRTSDDAKIELFNGDVWQWTETNATPGFTGATTANEIVDPVQLRWVAGFDRPDRYPLFPHIPPPPTIRPPGDNAMIATQNVRLADARDVKDSKGFPVFVPPFPDGTYPQTVFIKIHVVNPTGRGRVEVATMGPEHPYPAVATGIFNRGESDTFVTYVDPRPTDGQIKIRLVNAGAAQVVVDLDAAFRTAASTVEPHDHDDRYAPKSHDHDGYSPLGHGHDDRYAKRSHTHAAETTIGPPS